MEGVLDVAAARLRSRSPDAITIRLIVGEEELRAGRKLQDVRSDVYVVQQAGQRGRVRIIGEQGRLAAGIDH